MATLKNFQDLYVGNLAHKTGVVKDQLESGLYLLKRVGFYLRKIAHAKKTCAVEMSKFSEHELEKKERLVRDRMHQHVTAYQQMQHVMTQMAFFDLKFGSDILERVAEPLLNWHKEAELRLKKLVQQEEKLEAAMHTLRNKIKAERAMCAKLWNELVKDYREWQRSLASGDAKKIEKLERAFVARREKTQKLFAKFESMVEAGNAEQKSYWTKELPALVTAYEQLEVERMNELEARLHDYSTIQAEFSQPFPGMLSMIEQAVRDINGPGQLKGFVESYVGAVGKPEAPPAFVDGLPVDSAALLDSANLSALGNLLNADATQLCSQREAQQAKLAGNVLQVADGSSPSNSSSVHPSSGASTSAGAASSSSRSAPAIEFDFSDDPSCTYVRALYDFQSDDADDLTFTINTIIRVTLKGEDDQLAAEEAADAEPRWWRGRRLENIGQSNDGTFPSNYVRVCGLDREITLRHLLEIPSGLMVFSEFLKLEYATENISFWTRVEQFRNKCMQILDETGEIREEGKPAMLAEAQSIAREFIGNKAASQVNISSATLKATEDQLDGLPESLSLNMFDEAASEIMKMMNADSFARFKRHELFDQYLAAAAAAGKA